MSVRSWVCSNLTGRELGVHTEARILASEILEKCGVFWLQLAAKIEAFHIHLINTTNGEAVSGRGKYELWLVVLTRRVPGLGEKFFNEHGTEFVCSPYNTGSLDPPPPNHRVNFCFFVYEKKTFEVDASQNANTLT